MTIEVRLLQAGEEAVLSRVAPEVFDNAVDPALAAAFLKEPRHHIVVAIEEGVVVGFVSGVDYIHPDKPREMFVNEVGVSPAHQRRGIAKAVMAAMLEHARARGCRQAWVLTDDDNAAARTLYDSAGGRDTGGGIHLYEWDLP